MDISNKMKRLFMMIFSIASLMPFVSAKVHVGDNAPDFSLLDEQGTQRTLSAYRKSFVVLYFYPSDDTPGCTKQACSLRDNFAEFEKLNVIVLGISYDSPESHKKFKEKYKLPFTLLSDKKKKVAKKYGAKRWWWVPYPKRMTFIIDKEGIVRNILPNVDVATHTTQILSMLKAIK